MEYSSCLVSRGLSKSQFSGIVDLYIASLFLTRQIDSCVSLLGQMTVALLYF